MRPFRPVIRLVTLHTPRAYPTCVFTHTAIWHRRSVRLPDPDYTEPGAYFVTLCARDRRCVFGEVTLDGVRLTQVGEIVTQEWLRSADLRAEVELDAFVVMPNHIHGTVVISDISPQSHRSPRAHGRAPLRRPHLVSLRGFSAVAGKV